MRRVVATVPGVRVQSEANVRCHWSQRRRRFKAQSDAVALALACLSASDRDALRCARRVELTLVRLGGRKLDRDNLASAFKAILDAVCRWLRIDDGDEERLGLRWLQEPGGAYAVRIEMEACE